MKGEVCRRLAAIPLSRMRPRKPCGPTCLPLPVRKLLCCNLSHCRRMFCQTLELVEQVSTSCSPTNTFTRSPGTSCLRRSTSTKRKRTKRVKIENAMSCRDTRCCTFGSRASSLCERRGCRLRLASTYCMGLLY